MNRTAYIFFALFGFSCLGDQAVAQATLTCAPRDIVIERLSEKYGETPHALGLDNNNGFVELYANTQSGSWTITITNTHGTTCLLSSGQSFEALDGDASQDDA